MSLLLAAMIQVVSIMHSESWSNILEEGRALRAKLQQSNKCPCVVLATATAMGLLSFYEVTPSNGQQGDSDDIVPTHEQLPDVPGTGSQWRDGSTAPAGTLLLPSPGISHLRPRTKRLQGDASGAAAWTVL